MVSVSDFRQEPVKRPGRRYEGMAATFEPSAAALPAGASNRPRWKGGEFTSRQEAVLGAPSFDHSAIGEAPPPRDSTAGTAGLLDFTTSQWKASVVFNSVIPVCTPKTRRFDTNAKHSCRIATSFRTRGCQRRSPTLVDKDRVWRGSYPAYSEVLRIMRPRRRTYLCRPQFSSRNWMRRSPNSGLENRPGAADLKWPSVS